MTVVPVPTLVASPSDPTLLLIVATVSTLVSQATEVVRSCVVASEYVPIAVNCWVVPLAIEEFGGVTAIDWSTAALTYNVADPEMPLNVAVIVVPPALTVTPVARPSEPAALLIVATLGTDEAQVDDVVRFCVELSE